MSQFPDIYVSIFWNSLQKPEKSDPDLKPFSSRPSTSQHYNDQSPQPNPNQDLAQSFNTLTLSNPHEYGHTSSSEFVGGFTPGYTTGSYYSNPTQSNIPGPGKLPRPPSMPLPHTAHSAPQSLTMQMALQPQHKQNDFLSPNASAVRPHSAFVLPVPTAGPSPTSSPTLSLSHSQSSTPATKPKRPRASSTPTSSGSGVTAQQCAGVTKAGKRCTRQVKSGPALSKAYDGVDSAVIERFCFQHTKELLGPSGYYARKNGEWITFEGISTRP